MIRSGLEAAPNCMRTSFHRTDHFMSQEVLARRDARGDGECDFPLVRNHAINTPGLVGNVEAIFVDLEPLQPGNVRLRRVGDLGSIKFR